MDEIDLFSKKLPKKSATVKYGKIFTDFHMLCNCLCQATITKSTIKIFALLN